jgi:hypothetical protein
MFSVTLKDTFITRIAGLFALLSVVAQFGAMGIAVSRGVRPGGHSASATPRKYYRRRILTKRPMLWAYHWRRFHRFLPFRSASGSM